MSNYHTGVLAIERSENSKVGSVSATYVAQSTCPGDCPLRDAGCYAEKGPMSIHTGRLNRTRSRARTLASREAKGIDGLSGTRDLRVHVVGDCPTAESAGLVGAAMARYEARSGKRAWTYTHAWKTVSRAAWGNWARVLASCDSLSDVVRARRAGYATALVAGKGTDLFSRLKRAGRAMRTRYGTLVPCPNQVSPKRPTCVDCGLCMRPDWLRKTRTTIVFLEH